MPIEDMIPPNLPRYANKTQSFLEVGRGFRRTATEIGGLTPQSRVLDVGCGVGRFAVALTEFLDDGAYDGTDVVAESIDWCSSAITPEFPSFRFHLIEAKNEHYAPEHSASASQVPFAFEDASFDFVFSNSLYTHLLEEATVHYLREMARVLKPGGRMLSTIFLLDESARRSVASGGSANGWTLAHRIGEAHVEKADNPEAVVAYDEAFIAECVEAAGMTLEVLHGRWSGGHEGHRQFGNKDIIVCSVPGA